VIASLFDLAGKSIAALVSSLVVLLGAACSAQQPVARPTPSAPTPTPSRLAPAMVQVENAPGSKPHSGLQQANTVYEYLTEGNISRFTAIYGNSSGGARIEPVRSARLVTLKLVKAYGGVLFYSGASDTVQAQIDSQHLPAVWEGADGGKYFGRDRARIAPHNLYTTGDQLHAALEARQVRVTYPQPAEGEPTAQGDPVTKLSFPQTITHPVSYAYSASSRTYAYNDEDGPLVDAGNGGAPIGVTNVVLVRVAHHGVGYTEDVLGAEGIDFDLQGTGSGDLYTRGQHVAVKWDLTQGPMRLLGADGKALPLPAGLTWIHLIDPDAAVQASA
jgi:Protein of unknown function (DUF3048) N-terminal domain/Protein of unknown function (DUF3048) C-terminal domain